MCSQDEDLSSLVRFTLQWSSQQNWLSRTSWCPSPRRYFKQSGESAVAIYTTGGFLTILIFFQQPWCRKGNWKRREKLSSKIHWGFSDFLYKKGMVLFSLSLQKTSGASGVNFVKMPHELCCQVSSEMSMVHVSSSRNSAYLEDLTRVQKHFWRVRAIQLTSTSTRNQNRSEIKRQLQISCKKFTFHQDSFRKHETYDQVFNFETKQEYLHKRERMERM